MRRWRGAHRGQRTGRQVPVQPVDGEGRMFVCLDARYPARNEDACRHADGERSLAAGHVADEEHEQDRRGDIDIPEADLPLIIETPRDIGVCLHIGLLGVDAGVSDHRAHDRASDHQAHGGEDGEADVEQDRAEIAQSR